MLVRDFIKRSLYAKAAGYFNRVDAVISPAEALDFRSFRGRYDYMVTLAKLHEEQPEGWTTPVEIFKPHYSAAIAKFAMEQLSPGESLHVVEVGGGSGSNALHFMDFVKAMSPKTYESMKYTIVEIAETLVKRQRQVVSLRHPGKCNVIHQDFCRFDKKFEEKVFIVALEVLDNFPHDKLVRKVENQLSPQWWVFNHGEKDQWFQVRTDGERELLEPLQDDLCIATAELFLSETRDSFENHANEPGLISQKAVKYLFEESENSAKLGQDKGVFIPTMSLKFLQTIDKCFPRHELFIADFNSLPPPEISILRRLTERSRPGSLFGVKNAPLVSSKTAKQGNFDHSTYLVESGTSDIFFKTDFQALAHAYKTTVLKGVVRKESQQEFLRRFANHELTRTRTGFNPLIEDFENASVLIAKRR